jgi:hypothetical protein
MVILSVTYGVGCGEVGPSSLVELPMYTLTTSPPENRLPSSASHRHLSSSSSSMNLLRRKMPKITVAPANIVSHRTHPVAGRSSSINITHAQTLTNVQVD